MDFCKAVGNTAYGAFYWSIDKRARPVNPQ